MNQKTRKSPLTMSALDFREQNSFLTDSISTELLKRSRPYETDDAEDAEDANTRRRKRAVIATSEQPEEEP